MTNVSIEENVVIDTLEGVRYTSIFFAPQTPRVRCRVCSFCLGVGGRPPTVLPLKSATAYGWPSGAMSVSLESTASWMRRHGRPRSRT